MRLIYADELTQITIESLEQNPHSNPIHKAMHKHEHNHFLTLIDSVPTVDAVPVVHGRWIPLEYDGYADGNPVWNLWECSKCGEEHSGDEDTLTPYCPNCGAKMDGE